MSGSSVSKKSFDNLSETELRSLFSRNEKKGKKRNSFIAVFLPIFICLIGVLVAGAINLFPEVLDSEWPSVELGFFSGALAENGSTQSDVKPASEAASKQKQNAIGAANSDGSEVKVGDKLPDLRSWTPDELKMLAKLDERSRELDAKETRLKKVEEELEKQSAELEIKLKHLEKIRQQIATKLQDKVQVDEERVGKLVEFYANMKPQNAAKVFETIDEDLAVEVLIRMKKKNAADIMNLLPAPKSQVLSEKFAGYRGR
jgi:flagellar motility protein MotE (MotC chaperone)